jgi:hypothetical protein
MKRWTAVLAVLIVVVAVAAPRARGQEKFTIKLKELGPGETLRAESKEITVNKTQNQGEKDKEPSKAVEEKVTKDLVFTETVIQRPLPDKMPTKVKRVFDKAQITLSKDGAPAELKSLPHNGKTVWIEKKETAYEFRIDGGDVFKDPVLDNEFNGGQQEQHKRLFLPTQPVAEGGTWKIDTAPFLQGFKKDEKVTVSKAEGTAKLVKAYKKDGRQFGVIESAVTMEFKIDVKDVDPKVKGSTLSATQKVVMKMTFDGCIDGSRAEGRVQGTAEYGSRTVFRAPEMPAVTFITSGVTTGDDSWKEK